jgi:protein-disulfide isomerase
MRVAESASASTQPLSDLPLPSYPLSLAGATIVGRSDAPLAIIEYSDFQCPFCAQHFKETWPSLKRDFVDTGVALTALRHLPIKSHPYARAAAMTAECAASQGRFLDMHDLLFARQSELSEEAGRTAAADLGLDETLFQRCMSADAGQAVDEDEATALALGITGTPTFLIGSIVSGRLTVARVLVGSHPFADFKRTLDALHGSQRNPSVAVRLLHRLGM